VARAIHELLDDPPEVPDPPAERAGFLTMADAVATVAAEPEWPEAIRGDLQVHTTYSDGSLPLHEMVAAVAEHGYDYVGITDHSKGLPIANGMDEDRLGDEGRTIDALNEDLSSRGARIRVLKSIEMNLSPEGEGDMDPDALARLDLVLGAFHSKLRLREDQTERYLAAVSNPTIHVLAHPRTRMFGRRRGLDADWSRVFEAAAENGVAIELDATAYRQDLDVETARIAASTGVTFSMGTDAHVVHELGYMVFALATAILAGIPRERVLNFRPAEDVVEWGSR
jgi:histidinol phosphatase-like PHP family hydrolase